MFSGRTPESAIVVQLVAWIYIKVLEAEVDLDLLSQAILLECRFEVLHMGVCIVGHMEVYIPQ